MPVEGRSILGALLARHLGNLRHGIEHIGRYSLYFGLLLVALTSLRLPGGLGSAADLPLLFSMLCALVVIFLAGGDLGLSIFKGHGLGLFLFVFGVLISTAAASQDEWSSLINLLKFIFATSGTFFACVVLLKRRSHVRTALGCWVVSAAISSVFGVLQAWLGASVVGYVNPWRMPGLTLTPNGLGAIAALAIAPALSLAAAQSDWPRRLPWLLVMIVCVVGVVVSASRISAVIAVASLAIWVLMHYRLNRELTAMLAGLGLAAAGIAVFAYAQSGGQSIADRMAAIDLEKESGIQERLYHYDYVIDQALENPFVGVGLAKPDAQVWGVDVHNTFLMALRCGGLLSLLGIVIILGDVLQKGFNTIGTMRSYDAKSVSLALFIGAVGLLLNGLTDPILYQRQVWIPAALVVALYGLARHRRLSAGVSLSSPHRVARRRARQSDPERLR